MPPDGGEHQQACSEVHCITEPVNLGSNQLADYPEPDPDECLKPYEDALSRQLRLDACTPRG